VDVQRVTRAGPGLGDRRRGRSIVHPRTQQSKTGVFRQWSDSEGRRASGTPLLQLPGPAERAQLDEGYTNV
jgi:hypothetical protein